MNKEIHKPPTPKAGPQSNSAPANAPSLAPPTAGATAQGEQKKSPVLVRKLIKQRTSEPALVSPQRTQPVQTGQTGQTGQLQSPLQPERVGQAATAAANATSTNGRLSVSSYFVFLSLSLNQ